MKRQNEVAVRSSLTRTEMFKIGEDETVNEGSLHRRRIGDLVTSGKIIRTEVSKDRTSPQR